MSEMESSLDSFTGIARLFPLPNLVLYPQVLQPLHIFEPRYRQMTRDALDSDRLIAMALLDKNWEQDYLDKPAIHPIICLCKIVADQAQDDGRFNLLMRGVSRAKIIEEVPSDKQYRLARVELLKEIPASVTKTKTDLRPQLIDLVPLWIPNQPKVLGEFNKLLQSDISLSLLCDIISFTLPLPLEFKQEMLGEVHVEQRARSLLHRLQSKKGHKFPPEFSEN